MFLFILHWGTQVTLVQPKRASGDVMVPIYSYLRVHAQPKRFPAAYNTNWQVGCLYAAFAPI